MCWWLHEEAHLLVRQLLQHSQTEERLANQGACIWAPLKHGHKHCHASCEQQLHQASAGARGEDIVYCMCS